MLIIKWRHRKEKLSQAEKGDVASGSPGFSEPGSELRGLWGLGPKTSFWINEDFGGGEFDLLLPGNESRLGVQCEVEVGK